MDFSVEVLKVLRELCFFPPGVQVNLFGELKTFDYPKLWRKLSFVKVKISHSDSVTLKKACPWLRPANIT